MDTHPCILLSYHVTTSRPLSFPTPDYFISSRDVKEDLRKSCYSNAKAKHGPKTHHIIFYFGYGTNSFGKKKKKTGGARGRARDWPSHHIPVQATAAALLLSQRLIN